MVFFSDKLILWFFIKLKYNKFIVRKNINKKNINKINQLIGAIWGIKWY